MTTAALIPETQINRRGSRLKRRGDVSEARRAVEKLGAVSIPNPFLPEGKWLHEKR